MKQPKHYLVPFFAAILATTHAHGAITATDPTMGGINYQWTITIGANESLTTPNDPNSHVGAWSWNDTDFVNMMGGGPDMGWTHTTSWAALQVTETTTLTIVMGGNSSVPYGEGYRPTNQLIPAFTVWSGWDSTADFNNSHIYNNNGLISWSSDLTEMVGRLDNSTETTGELTLTLEAGYYTIAFGSNLGDAGSVPNQGYYATFTTVPEPSGALLGVATVGLLALRRRR